MHTFQSLPTSSRFMTEIISLEIENRGIDRILKTIRIQLDMGVVFVSRSHTYDRVSQNLNFAVKIPFNELPEFRPEIDISIEISKTKTTSKGAHLSVPILLDNGDIYGTLCWARQFPSYGANECDNKMMRAFASVLGALCDENLRLLELHRAAVDEFQKLMSEDRLCMSFQSICQTEDKQIVGIECLARFDVTTVCSPDLWFAAAHAAGLGIELEIRAIRKSLLALSLFPENIYISINVSSSLLLAQVLTQELAQCDLSRIVLELNEHIWVTQSEALVNFLAPLRLRGVRLAINNIGADYASMKQALNMKPDIIKIDRKLIGGIDMNPSHQTLVKGLISFAHAIQCTLTAVGVETQQELDTLRWMKIENAQGYYFGPLLSIEDGQALF